MATKPLSAAAEKAKAALEGKPRLVKTLSNADYVSTGLTPLNLACSGRVFGGLERGHIYRLIGKSQTGKTFIGGSILCEAAINPTFVDYELIHNDIERGAKMDPRKFWQPLVGRLKSPLESNWEPPKTLSDWFDQTRARLDKGKPFIEITDSLDILSDDAETKMSDGRAKALSQRLRKLIADLQSTKSIVVLVQHAKVNLGNTWSELVTTGGASPEFYSTLDIWLSKCETIKRKVPGKDVELPVGVMFQAHVRKNRTNGVDRVVRYPLYYEYGLDDVGACIWCLLEYEHWKKEKGRIEAPEFGFSGFQFDLVKKIEAENKIQELRVLTGKVWREIEAALSQNRKPKYGG